MKTILAATDGSNHARRALELANTLAANFDAKLVLLHVTDSRPLGDAEERMAKAEYANLIKDRALASDVMDVRALGPKGANPIYDFHAETGLIIRTALGEGILTAAAKDAKASGVKDVVTVIENGDPAAAILTAARRQKADTIVIGSRGLSDLKGLFLGSVSHKVASAAEANVITVK